MNEGFQESRADKKRALAKSVRVKMSKAKV